MSRTTDPLRNPSACEAERAQRRARLRAEAESLRAERLAARGRAWYDSDPDLDVPTLAADSLDLKIGEAVRRLPEDVLTRHSSDPEWQRAIGMRHRLAHEYGAVDYELVWRVVARHAATLRARAESFLVD